MDDEKNMLRNALFEKYFEQEEGIVLKDLVGSLDSVVHTWQKMHKILVENVKPFSPYMSIGGIKNIEHNGNNYLIIDLLCCKYIIFERETNKVLSEEEVQSKFSHDFFVNNFYDYEIEDMPLNWMEMYEFLECDDSFLSVVDFCDKNKSDLELSEIIDYKIKIGDAWTYLNVDFANNNVHFGFQTPDQFLYEHLFMDTSLIPSSLQDTIEKIGVDKMMDMFERIKDVKIPESYIPTPILNRYLSNSKMGSSQNNVTNFLIKTMNKN